MNKSDIRKKILKIRKKNYKQNFEVNFNSIFKILKKKNIYSKNIGGYYPYNYELNTIKILENFEKKQIFYFFAKNKKKLSNEFF